MAGSSIVTNPAAHGNHYACARALCTLLLLQAAPLKCALTQTRHHVPNSRACPSRCANETMCTHHSDMLTKCSICFVRFFFLQLKKPLLGPKRFAQGSCLLRVLNSRINKYLYIDVVMNLYSIMLTKQYAHN